MKILIPLMAVLFLAACTGEPKSDLKTDKEKVSYAIGQMIGPNLKNQKLDIDASAFAMSINDVLKGNKPKMSPEESQKALQSLQSSRMAEAKAEGDKNKTAGDAFLEKNKSEPGWKTTKDGLQ
jgi:FKBP-type peptidyl-prolyl cis-trans isomerase FkpA